MAGLKGILNCCCDDCCPEQLEVVIQSNVSSCDYWLGTYVLDKITPSAGNTCEWEYTGSNPSDCGGTFTLTAVLWVNTAPMLPLCILQVFASCDSDSMRWDVGVTSIYSVCCAPIHDGNCTMSGPITATGSFGSCLNSQLPNACATYL